MNRWQWAAMPALAAALCGLFAAELLLPAPPPPLAPAAAAIAAAPAAPADADRDQWAATALARPLFNPSRRPAPRPGATPAATLPRLSAVIVTGGVRRAIFTQAGQPPLVAGVGGAIAGYRITAIAPDQVKLAGPAGLLTLRPQFASGGAGFVSAPSAPPASPAPPAAAPVPPLATSTPPARLDDDPI